MSELGIVNLNDLDKNNKSGSLLYSKGRIKFKFESLPDFIYDKRKKRVNGKYFNENTLLEFEIKKTQEGQIANKIQYLDNRLPHDTRAILTRKVDKENFSLRLNKSACFDEDKFKFYKKNFIDIDKSFPQIEFKKKVRDLKAAIQKTGLIINSPNIELRPSWRLIVGLGNESVYETGITLHHIYGFPYIPGSAIKGILRNWIIEKEYNKLEGNKNVGAYHDEGFCRIFGSPKDSKIGEHAGIVHFFDAYPTEEPKIEPDVMNPHYSPYYTEDKPPADYYNPVPIFFLTVKDATFEFIFGIKKKDSHNIYGEKINGNPLELVQNWLPNALSEHGLGAKTAVGYGYFKEIKEITNTFQN